MDTEIKKVEILDYQPTHIQLKFLPYGTAVKMGKQFFKKKVNSGEYEVVNKDMIPRVI